MRVNFWRKTKLTSSRWVSSFLSAFESFIDKFATGFANIYETGNFALQTASMMFVTHKYSIHVEVAGTMSLYTQIAYIRTHSYTTSDFDSFSITFTMINYSAYTKNGEYILSDMDLKNKNNKIHFFFLFKAKYRARTVKIRHDLI